MRRREILAGGLALAGASLLPRSASAAGTLLQHLGSPQDLATPLTSFDRLITPADIFFVRSHFGPPALDPKRTLTVEGAKQKLPLRAADLRKFPEVTVTAVLQCAGNGRAMSDPPVAGVQWVHGAMGQATWTGVRLVDLLEKAGLPADAAHVRFQGADLPPKPAVPAWIRSLPLARAIDPTTIVAYRMNGEPLPLSHGAPLRLVVPGWSGNHWMKWLTSIRAQREEAEGFYMQTGYRYPNAPVAPGTAVKPADMSPVTSFPVKSLIARPADGARAQPGPQEVVGVAFSGLAPIERVEVSVDGGARWEVAKLEGEPGLGRWQVFRHLFEASRPGEYRVLARATDTKGNAQPEKAPWNPSGYFWNAWHAVSFTVAA